MARFHPVLDKRTIDELGTMKPYEHEYKYFFETWTDGVEDDFLGFVQKYPGFPVVMAIVYVAFLFYGKRYMSKRPPFDLRMALAIWSGILAIFSILGAARSLPELIYTIREYSFHHSMCHPSFLYGVPGFWTIMFVLSKPYELGDTAFIILRKQKLIFLHWYHHITVMLFAWLCYYEHLTAGRWYLVMNFTVHAFMYTYYTLRALRYRIPRWVQVGITSMQIAQMAVGCFTFVYYYWLRMNGHYCQMTPRGAFWGSIMYASYFILFAMFFYKTYMKKSPSSSQTEARTADSSDKVDSKNDEPNQNFGLPSGEQLNEALRSLTEIGRSGYMKNSLKKSL